MSEATACRTLRILFALLTLLLAPFAHANEDYLDPEKAFRFSARMLDPGTAEITYTIADGYYMYRERFAFKASGATLGEPIMPKGKVKFDETFQKDVETYRKNIVITLPVKASGTFTLKSSGQGCADKGLCYPPMESEARLSATGGLMAAVNAARNTIAANTDQDENPSLFRSSGAAATDTDMGRIEASLKSGNLLAIVPLFFLLGLGLAFTPCVLPMVPILSSIIVGDDLRGNRGRGFVLSVAYSLGMALVYTGLGIAAGLIGEGLSAGLQNSWVLVAFALLMAALSLSMFDVYQLQVPAAIQARLMRASDRQSAGKLAGVFAMGAISALIVGPCVASPLAGALLYISQTRDVFIGGSALFTMAIGMSVPLILVGVSAGTLLPRAGAWMEAMKTFFGVLMLGLAVWIVAPVVPGWVAMLGWGMLGGGYGTYLLKARRKDWMSRIFGLLFALFGLAQLTGMATGGKDPLAPLAHLRAGGVQHTEFKRVRSLAELDRAIAESGGRIVMLDFYADWCVSCKEMEKITFADEHVRGQFGKMLLLQADVTANNEDDKALLRRFGLFGPPGIIFFDKQGREIPGGRVIGYQDTDKFMQTLQRAGSF